jgi:hypothetical protein
MFKLFGLLVALYTLYAATKGHVFAKSGARVRWISRAASPRYFWIVISVYGGLSVALFSVF